MLSQRWKEKLMSQVISPTSMKQRDECGRAGILYQASGKDKYDPLHSLFGSAFGLGCAAYATHPEKQPDARRGLAVLNAATLWGFTQKLETKDWPNLVNLLIAYAKLFDESGRAGVETETRILVEVHSPELTWTLGGTFDLMSATHDGGVIIDDFKAVASEYFYAWEADPQILHYTLLQYIRYRHDPNAQCPTDLGMYWVAVLPGSGEVSLHLRRNHSGVWRTLPAHFRKAKAQALEFRDAAAYGLDVLPTNPRVCNGRRSCFFIPQCYDGETFTESWSVDTRNPDRVVKITCTEQDILQYITELSAILERAEAATKAADLEANRMAAQLQAAASFNLNDLEISTNGHLTDFIEG